MVVGSGVKARCRRDGKHITTHRKLAGVKRNHPAGAGSIIENGDATKAAQYDRLTKGDRDGAWRTDGGVIRWVGTC